jgi:general secretion pathway protein D
VTLKMKIEVSSESGTSTISGVTEPIISQRTAEQTIRLREGEAQILGGILDKEDIASSSGIPGLGELPLLKYIFGSKSHEVKDDEIVFVLIPHVVRGQVLTPLNLRTIDTGSGQTIELRRSFSPKATPAPAKPAGGVAGRPAGVPEAGGLPGQTAAAAVSSAMAQLRQSSQDADPAMSGGSHPAVAPPVTAAPVPTVPATAPAGAATPAAGPVAPANFVLTPPAVSPAAGANFPLAVMLNGAKDVSSVPLQIQYDASKLSLINVDAGDLLGKDGQAVALVHRDDGPGLITIAASRPPGTPGITGSGTVCVLTFQAKQAGDSDVVVTRPGALDSGQHPVPATAENAHVVVK